MNPVDEVLLCLGAFFVGVACCDRTYNIDWAWPWLAWGALLLASGVIVALVA